MSKGWQGYEGDAGRQLAELYESVPSETVHDWLVDLLPEAPAAVLDVGAGSGRDAAWFARQGYTVVALEPAATLREEARSRHRESSITWIADSLPGLDHVYRLGTAFDVILLSAVWMHVPPADRRRAFRKLIGLLKPNGVLAITLRHGPPDPHREMHPVSTEELLALGKAHGAIVLKEEREEDRLGRPEVSWSQLAFRLPDDGTGALPLLRHVILNDAKSATYKLGLLRAVARAADAAQGTARYQGDDTVIVPLGLIALNWLRLYKPLVDAGLPQSPTNSGPRGLGFAKAGWAGISDLSPLNLRVGARFSGDMATSLHAALRDAAATIEKMPATYMTFPGSGEPILDAARQPAGRVPDHLTLDAAYLWRFGELRVPLHLWRALVRHDAWIEPALVLEWQRLMESYATRQGRMLDTGKVAQAMKWHDPARDVGFARRIACQLLETRSLHCVWSGKRLTSDRLDMDHCLPWAAWPCEDLWNLLPAHPGINRNSKRDRLPSAGMLEKSMDRILDWWHAGYVDRDGATAARFHTEAEVSLPVDMGTTRLEDLFTGVQVRRQALRADQLIEEWGL